MIELETLKLRNIVTYKGKNATVVPLNKYPMVVVRGANHDRRSIKAASNASGKSILYGTGLKTPLYFEPPASVRKNSARDVMTGSKDDTSTIDLTFSNEQHQYESSIKSKGKTFGLDISRDGEDLGIRKVGDAKAYVSRIWPLSEEQFDASVLIDGRTKSILQSGKPDQRFDFFESMFRLDLFDTISAKINKQYNTLKQDKQQLDYVGAERSKLTDPEDVDVINKQLNKLQSNIDIVQDRIRKYLEELAHTRTYLTLSADDRPDLSDKEIKDQIALISAKIIEYKEKYKKAVSFNDTFQTIKSLKEKLADVDEELSRCPLPAKIDPKLQFKIDKLNLSIRAIDDQLNDHLDAQIQFEEIEEQLKTVGLSDKLAGFAKKKSSDTWSSLAKDLIRKLKDKKEQLAPLQELVGKKTCPCCSQSLPEKYLTPLIETLKTEISELTEKAKKYRKYSSYMEVFEQTKELKLLSNKEELTKKADELGMERLKLQQTAFNIKKNAELQALKEQTLSLMPKLPSKVIDDPETLASQLEILESTLALLNQYKNCRIKLKKLPKTYASVKEAKQVKAKYTKFIDEYSPKLKAAQSKFNGLTVKLTTARNLKEKIKELDTQIKALQKTTKDFDLYEALREAYGAIGLRILQVRHLAEVYCQNLNKYSGLIYPEPITFNIEVDKGIFNILATRNGMPSDVRKFSGSESSSFTLLSLISLLPLIPSSLRTNLLVLDEIESGLDEPSLSLFTDQLLPQLNKVVPNIVIITPRSEREMPIPGAKTFKVTKKGGISSLSIS